MKERRFGETCRVGQAKRSPTTNQVIEGFGRWWDRAALVPPYVFGVVALLWLASCQPAAATSPTPAEMEKARQWASAHFDDANGSKPFFSFTYDGKPSADLLGKWELKRASRQLDQQRTEHTLTYTDPKTGLVVRCVGIEYRDFPTVEWTLYFKNTGKQDTPILAGVQALDIEL
jgi:hypothetical protein